jgi:hypothetical protein
MQQIQMENRIQMQQTFLEQFVRCLPMNLGGTSSRLPSTVFQAPNLPVVSGPAACPPTVLDSSGLTPEQWASAVETPPVIEAKALDGSASKHYVKVARKFEENVLRYQNSDRNLRQVRADIDEMKNSSVRFRYPPGTRPWTSHGDGVQLDQLWIPSKEEDYVVSIVVPKGSTRREVLQQLHHCHEMSRKDVHAEALCEHVNLLKPLTTRSAFFRACAEFKRDELEDLDLAHGRQVTANGKLALKKCEDLYSSVIDRIRAKRTSDKKSEEDKARIEKEKEEVLKKLDPKAALQGMVQAAVHKAVGEVKMDVDATPTDVRPSISFHDIGRERRPGVLVRTTKLSMLN